MELLNNKLLIQRGCWKAETKAGEGLRFEKCKGGYFSVQEEYGLKVVGKTRQNNAPSIVNPQPIQCVKSGSKIRVSGNDLQWICSEITVPCDLYEGDIWYPLSGKVERYNYVKIANGTEKMEMKYRPTAIILINNRELYGDWYYKVYSTRFSNIDISNATGSGIGCRLDLNNLPTDLTDERFLSILKGWYDIGEPLKIVYRLKVPLIEQYELQSAFAPQGTVNIFQSPLEMSADLSATTFVYNI